MPLSGAVLPPFGETALLLDCDGTLLDIAPNPDAVVVPRGLPATLRRLRAQMGDALAIVTGRPVDQIDGLFPGIPFAVAGEHGGAIRTAPGAGLVRVPLPDPPVDWVMEAARLAEQHPGALLEQKQRGFVLHYRAAPEAGPALGAAVERLIAPLGDGFQMMAALMAWEVRPRGANKGSAVETLMTAAPFLGRKPFFVGDDVTDEDGMEAARKLGGAGLRVDTAFGTAEGFRQWLARAAELSDWPPLG